MRKIFLFSILVLQMLVVQAFAVEHNWELEADEDGITVSSREVDGKGLPTFRGVAVINAHMLDILAVLADTPNNPKWMHRCAEARMLKLINKMERIVYNRTDAPWPVSDRDAVIYTKATINNEKHEVLVSIDAIESSLQGPIDGVVRMSKLKGFYKLTALDLDKTKVVYQVDADPGGMLPDWVKRMGAKDLPYITLKNLRKRVKQMTGKYEAFKSQYVEETRAMEELGKKKLAERDAKIAAEKAPANPPAQEMSANPAPEGVQPE